MAGRRLITVGGVLWGGLRQPRQGWLSAAADPQESLTRARESPSRMRAQARGCSTGPRNQSEVRRGNVRPLRWAFWPFSRRRAWKYPWSPRARR